MIHGLLGNLDDGRLDVFVGLDRSDCVWLRHHGVAVLPLSSLGSRRAAVCFFTNGPPDRWPEGIPRDSKTIFPVSDAMVLLGGVYLFEAEFVRLHLEIAETEPELEQSLRRMQDISIRRDEYDDSWDLTTVV